MKEKGAQVHLISSLYDIAWILKPAWKRHFPCAGIFIFSDD